MAAEPYESQQYAGTEARVNEAAALTGIAARGMLGGGGVPGVVEDAVDLAGAATRTDAYVTAQEAKARSDGLGTQSGPSPTGTVYKAIPHARLYAMTHQNIDPAGIYQNGASWNELGNQYANSADSVLKAVSASEASWQGEAAEHMRTALARTATWMGDVGQGAQAVSAQLYAQSEAASTVRNAVPEPTGFDAGAAVTALLTGGPEAFQQNIQQQAQAANDAHTAAAEAVARYEQSLHQATATVPAFTAPPQPTSTGSAPSPTPPTGSTPPQTMRTNSTRPARPTSGSEPPARLSIETAPDGHPADATNPSTDTTTAAFPLPSQQSGDPGTGNDGREPTVDLASSGLPLNAGLGDVGGNQRLGGSLNFGARPGEGATESEPRDGARSGAGADDRAGTAEAVGEGAKEKPGLAGMTGAGARKDKDKERKASSLLRNNDLGELITEGLERTVPPTIGENGR